MSAVGAARWNAAGQGSQARGTVPPNKRMKQTSLSAAPGKMEAPPRAPEGRTDGRTGSQLMRRVRRT